MLCNVPTSMVPQRLVSDEGAIRVLTVLFAEAGLAVGLIQTSGSPLLTRGLLSAPPLLSEPPHVAAAHLSVIAVIAAGVTLPCMGAQTGYLRGADGLPGLLADPDQPRLRQVVAHARRVLERRGAPCAVVRTRFVPVVRPVVNPRAAATGLSDGRFASSQVVGSMVRTSGLVFAADLLATTVPSAEDHHVAVTAILLVLSLVPVGLETLRGPVAAADLALDRAR